MLIDSKSLFSDEQAITATADSTNKVNVMKMLGKGNPVHLDIRVTEAFNNLTSLKVELQQCATESGTYAATSFSQTVTLASGGLALGKRIGPIFLPRDVTQPWLKLVYTVTGTAPSTGAIFAAITREISDWYETGQFIDKGVTVA